MRVGFITQGSLQEYLGRSEEESADVLFFGFEGMGLVSYERELKGESGCFEEGAKLSKNCKNIVVSGCFTDTRGIKRKSAFVAEKGRILGVSDAVRSLDSGVASGAALRVYDTAIGKMGVLVAEDLYFPELIKTLSLCGTDFILCPFGKVTDSMQTVLMRAYAYCYGVPIFFCARGYAALVAGDGKLLFASPQPSAYVDFTDKKEYRLIQERHRGSFCCSI